MRWRQALCDHLFYPGVLQGSALPPESSAGFYLPNAGYKARGIDCCACNVVVHVRGWSLGDGCLFRGILCAYTVEPSSEGYCQLGAEVVSSISMPLQAMIL